MIYFLITRHILSLFRTPVGLGHMDYLWHAAIPEDYESAVDQIAMSTVGALANYHPVLMNVVNTIGSIDYDDSIVDRNTDLGAGAFSYHRSRNLTASRDISAGEELFDEYVLSCNYSILCSMRESYYNFVMRKCALSKQLWGRMAGRADAI